MATTSAKGFVTTMNLHEIRRGGSTGAVALLPLPIIVHNKYDFARKQTNYSLSPRE